MAPGTRDDGQEQEHLTAGQKSEHILKHDCPLRIRLQYNLCSNSLQDPVDHGLSRAACSCTCYGKLSHEGHVYVSDNARTKHLYRQFVWVLCFILLSDQTDWLGTHNLERPLQLYLQLLTVL